MIRVWDSGTGEERGQLKSQSTLPIQSLHIFSEGKTLIAHGVDGAVRFWDVETKRELRRLPKQNDGVLCLALSRDDRLLYTGSSTGVIRQWLAATGLEMRQFTGHPGPIRRLLLSPDGKQIISAGLDGSVRAWDVAKGGPTRVLEIGPGPRGSATRRLRWRGTAACWPPQCRRGRSSCGISPHSSRGPGRPRIRSTGACSPSHPTARSWRSPSAVFPQPSACSARQPARNFGNSTSNTASFTRSLFPPTGSSWPAPAITALRIWEVGASGERHVERGHFGAIHSIHLAPDGMTALSTGNDRSARVCNTVTGKELGRFEAARMPLLNGGVLGDGKSFISIGQGGVVQWELADGVAREIRRLPMLKTIDLLTRGPLVPDVRVTLSLDGKWLAAAPPGARIALWDLTAGGEPRLWATVGPVAALMFSPDSRWLVSSGVSIPTQIWDPPTGKLARQLAAARGSNILAFSADGMTLATHDNGVRLWEFATGQERTQLTLPVPYAMAFSPDGNVLAVSDFNGSIRLWDVFADREVGELAGHRGAVKALVFSPDGKRLISGSLDSAMLVWDATAWSKKRDRPAVPLQNEDLELAWRMLAGAEAAKAFQAITTLAAAPAQAVPMLKERLRPVPEVKPEQMARWIADLDGTGFVVREKAMSELARREAAAESALVKALQAPAAPSLEMRRAWTRCWKSSGHPIRKRCAPFEPWRSLNALTACRRGSLLAALAGGCSGLQQTEAARAASNRSDKRHR